MWTIILLLIIFCIIVILLVKAYKDKNHRKDTYNYYRDYIFEQQARKHNTKPEQDSNDEDFISKLRQKYPNQQLYSKKLLQTNREQEIYRKLKNIIGTQYLLQAQVNLATIVYKNFEFTYQNELYRNIDFGIFDKNTFEILVLIELNDNSHLAQNRQARDIKVKQILEEAHIPLITLWTTYDNSAIYIKNRLKEFIDI